MKKSDKILESLIKSAKQAKPADLSEAPFGFSTRVAAQWSTSRGKMSFADSFQFLSLRVFTMAVCIAFGSLLFYMHASSLELSVAQDFLVNPGTLTLESFL